MPFGLRNESSQYGSMDNCSTEGPKKNIFAFQSCQIKKQEDVLFPASYVSCYLFVIINTCNFDST